MIRVERSESPAPGGDTEAFLASLDTQQGAWLGCDVEAEGLYERKSMGCANPSLGFYLDGNRLRVVPLSPVGQALLEHVRPLAAFDKESGNLSIGFSDTVELPHPVIGILRAFLALFDSPAPELSFFGAFSFDYYRLATGCAVPDDGRRRMVLYFPGRVVVAGRQGATWVDFRFPDLETKLGGAPSGVEPVRFQQETDDLPPGGHAERVVQGVERLREGELYSLVLSQTFRRRVSAKSSVAFDALRKLNPYPGMFFLNLGGGEMLFGASPDIQVRADSAHVESAPVCGTFRRGADPIADADQALALLNSAKEDAALAACSDSDRNDKATVCMPGSLGLVSRRRVHFFSTIIHTIDHTRGRRRQGADVFDILLAHSAPATVTGLPKPAAIRAIEEIESSWRGWYAGAVVRLATDGSMEALTVLRAARVAGDIAEVRTGGNLLVDSDPGKEEDETCLKAETLFRVLGGASPRAPVTKAQFDRRFGIAFFDGGDPMGPLLLECLASVGCEVQPDSPEAIAILGDGHLEEVQRWSGGTRRIVAVGRGALALLGFQGARLTHLVEPRYARRVQGRSLRPEFLSPVAVLDLGIYTREVIKVRDLPAQWRAGVVTQEDWVLAAFSVEGPQAALFCRPDSVQSIKGDSGRLLLNAALNWAADWNGRF